MKRKKRFFFFLNKTSKRNKFFSVVFLLTFKFFLFFYFLFYFNLSNQLISTLFIFSSFLLLFLPFFYSAHLNQKKKMMSAIGWSLSVINRAKKKKFKILTLFIVWNHIDFLLTLTDLVNLIWINNSFFFFFAAKDQWQNCESEENFLKKVMINCSKTAVIYQQKQF